MAGAALAASLLLAACGGDGEYRTNKIFVDPTWSGEERFVYDLEQEGRSFGATCILGTERQDDSLLLTRACESEDGYRDEGMVLVDPETLEPAESARSVYDVEDDSTVVHAIRYEPPEAHFETRVEDREDSRTTSRDLPEPTEDWPTPGWYDDESIFWLVRGIELREGYEDHYTHVINAGQPRVLSADIEVQDREEITVPAGTFSTYRVRISSGNVVYRYWVEDSGAHRVVRAQIEDSTYELVEAD